MLNQRSNDVQQNVSRTWAELCEFIQDRVERLSGQANTIPVEFQRLRGNEFSLSSRDEKVRVLFDHANSTVVCFLSRSSTIRWFFARAAGSAITFSAGETGTPVTFEDILKMFFEALI